MTSRDTHHPLPVPLQSIASPISNRYSKTNKFAAGFLSGIIVAGAFNPWDRALYLSVIHERAFLDRANFKNPYKGFYQALFHRTLSSGLYFPLFDLFEPVYSKHVDSSLLVHFLAGNTAGAVSGVVLNQFTAIKYASWDAEHGFLSTTRQMWREGGIKPFMKGIVPTVCRDTIFGGIFAVTKEGTSRLIKRASNTNTGKLYTERAKASGHFELGSSVIDFMASMVAGAAGTVVSSPFNYVRNIKYSWSAAEQPPSSMTILRNLYIETGVKSQAGGWFAGWNHVQDRLRIGWGTARVAVGMAVGYEIYDVCKRFLDNRQVPELQHSALHSSVQLAEIEAVEVAKQAMKSLSDK